MHIFILSCKTYNKNRRNFTMITVNEIPATQAVLSQASSLATVFDSAKNPEDSQSPGYQKRKKPARPDANDAQNNDEERPYAPIKPSAGGASRRHIPMYDLASPEAVNPLPMLRRRAEAYEKMMQVF
jgi:hypothetical protein